MHPRLLVQQTACSTTPCNAGNPLQRRRLLLPSRSPERLRSSSLGYPTTAPSTPTPLPCSRTALRYSRHFTFTFYVKFLFLLPSSQTTLLCSKHDPDGAGTVNVVKIKNEVGPYNFFAADMWKKLKDDPVLYFFT